MCFYVMFSEEKDEQENSIGTEREKGCWDFSRLTFLPLLLICWLRKRWVEARRSGNLAKSLMCEI